MDKQHQWNLWFFLVAFSLLLVFQNWWSARSAVEPIAYSEFMRLLKEEKLSDLRIEQQQISGKLKDVAQEIDTSHVGHLDVRYDQIEVRCLASSEPFLGGWLFFGFGCDSGFSRHSIY